MEKKCHSLHEISDDLVIRLHARTVCHHVVRHADVIVWSGDDAVHHLRLHSHFLPSPFAGVWVDRFNRKTLIILADSMIAFVTLILAITFLSGYNETWLLFVAAAVRTLGTGIQTTAVAAFLPQIVPEEHLTKVNGINGTLQALMMFIAPIVSASLLTVASI